MKRLVSIVCAVTSGILIILPVFACAQTEKPTIAVMDFANESGRSEYDYLQGSISENIITTIAQSQNVTVVERARLMAALNELKLGQTGLVDASAAAEVGNALGADGIIVGSLTILGNEFRLNARLIDVETIQVKYAKQVAGTNISSIVDRMSDLLLMEITPDLSEKQALLVKLKLRDDLFKSQLKSPGTAAIGGFLIPIVGHAYVGGSGNIIRGVLYTIASPTLIIIGATAQTDDTLPGMLIAAAGVHLVSAVDAALSASSNNKKIRTGGVKLGLYPNPVNKSFTLSLSYRF